MKPLLAITLILHIILCPGWAQKENNYWFFGDNVGLDFNTSPPTSITGGLNSYEGCASISDQMGRLLFYTDGTTVFNRQGLVMNNGSGLFGSTSSTSSALIVPDPCSETSYYIFTTDDVSGSNGLNYNIVEMDNNGDCYYDPSSEFGRVVLKNQRLAGSNGEKVCALKKSNGIDYWVLATYNGASGFYVYELTQSGISLHSVQGTGPVIDVYGYLKASRSGKLLAAASSSGSQDYVLIYSFDKSTGKVLHQTTINPNRDLIYGIEFSENERYLYYSCNAVQAAPSNAKDVFSYGLISGINFHLHTSNNIPVVIPNNTYANLGALQMGPDGRIYVAKGRTIIWM